MRTHHDDAQVQVTEVDQHRLWLTLVEQSAGTELLRQQLDAFRGSLSWRLTAPLRRLRALLGGSPQPVSLRGKESSGVAVGHADGGLVPRWVGELLARQNGSMSRCLVDVTELDRRDLGAGVERVTRRLLGELLMEPPVEGWIQPVRLHQEGGYVCANHFLARFLGVAEGTFGADVPLTPRVGDCFIGLDHCRGQAPALRAALTDLKQAGVPITLLVHDVLPLTHPEWFPAFVTEEFEAWLRVLATFADRALCNSLVTAQELSTVLEGRGLRSGSMERRVFPLGADLPVLPSTEMVPRKDQGMTRVLTVGTIEPRKGHAQALDAFEWLWRDGKPFQWVIAGRAGWSVDGLLKRIRRHPEFGRRLLWVDGPDDRMLAGLYRQSDMLLAPTLGEGYGLPVAEAGRLGVPLVLRDLAVFGKSRETTPSTFPGWMVGTSRGFWRIGR